MADTPLGALRALSGKNENGMAMSTGPLIDKFIDRITLDQGEGDIAYFHALLLQLEYPVVGREATERNQTGSFR